MSIFDHFFTSDALAKQREREQKTPSDIKVEREIEFQDALRSDFTAIKTVWPSDDDEKFIGTPQWESYCKAIAARMAQPMKLGDSVQDRRLKAIQENKAVEEAWKAHKEEAWKVYKSNW